MVSLYSEIVFNNSGLPCFSHFLFLFLGNMVKLCPKCRQVSRRLNLTRLVRTASLLQGYAYWKLPNPARHVQLVSEDLEELRKSLHDTIAKSTSQETRHWKSALSSLDMGLRQPGPLTSLDIVSGLVSLDSEFLELAIFILLSLLSWAQALPPIIISLNSSLDHSLLLLRLVFHI